MILSNKMVDAVIAISQAQHDVATNSKSFQENLKNLVDTKAALDSSIDEMKTRQNKIDSDLADIEMRLSEADSKEAKAETAFQRADKLKADLKVDRATIADGTARNAEKHSDLKEFSKALDNRESAFKTFYDNKTSELTDREIALKVKEDHAAEVMAVMKK